MRQQLHLTFSPTAAIFTSTYKGAANNTYNVSNGKSAEGFHLTMHDVLLLTFCVCPRHSLCIAQKLKIGVDRCDRGHLSLVRHPTHAAAASCSQAGFLAGTCPAKVWPAGLWRQLQTCGRFMSSMCPFYEAAPLYFCRAHLWPKIAEWFGNEAGPPLKVLHSNL